MRLNLKHVWWHQLAKVIYHLLGLSTIIFSVIIYIYAKESVYANQRYRIRQQIDGLVGELLRIDKDVEKINYTQIGRMLQKKGVLPDNSVNNENRILLIDYTVKDILLKLGAATAGPTEVEKNEGAGGSIPKKQLSDLSAILKTFGNGISADPDTKVPGKPVGRRVLEIEREMVSLLLKLDRYNILGQDVLARVIYFDNEYLLQLLWLLIIPVYYLGAYLFYTRAIVYVVVGKMLYLKKNDYVD